VRVRDENGDRVCFLSGHRVVVGDEVQWVEAPGSGGKITAVNSRQTCLRRLDHKGREQVLAANIEGLLIVDTGSAPPLNPVMLDRFLLYGARDGLGVALVLNKCDLEIFESVRTNIAIREPLGLQVLFTSTVTDGGLEPLNAFMAEKSGPWALVGRSGVGKTSLISGLLPQQDVGPVGDMSEYWGTGRHTTTRACLFTLPHGGELVDSPGIRQFIPGGLTSEICARHFPGIGDLPCKYRNCLHRPDEEGCAASEHAEPALLSSYRTLFEELVAFERRHKR